MPGPFEVLIGLMAVGLLVMVAAVVLSVVYLLRDRKS